MANQEQVEILQQGVEAWNTWRKEHPEAVVDLSGINLSRAVLSGVNLSYADLSNAVLQEIVLNEADLSSAKLSKADFSVPKNTWQSDVAGRSANLSYANFYAADFSEANLSEAHLTGSDLSYASFTAANLGRAMLTATNLNYTNFSGVNLSEAQFVEATGDHPLFEGANLTKANLDRANLSEAYLRQANLTEAILNGANLFKADLIQANLGKASLMVSERLGVDPIRTNLQQAQLIRANLEGAYLTDADLRDANLREADLDDAVLRGADLSGANLNQAQLVRTEVSQANISGSSVYAINVWDLKGEFSEQKNLNVSPEGEAAITVDDVEMAQFIYLVLNNQKLRDVLDTITSKSVLILGRFKLPERKEILDALREKLREYNLVPIVFDFDRPTDKDFTETIKTLAGLSYFVIADVTNPKSSPLELQATVPDYQIPFVPIIQKDEKPFAMMSDLQQKYHWVLETRTYSSKEVLLKALKKWIIEPAMEKHSKLRLIKAQKPNLMSLDDLIEAEQFLGAAGGSTASDRVLPPATSAGDVMDLTKLVS